MAPEDPSLHDPDVTDDYALGRAPEFIPAADPPPRRTMWMAAAAALVLIAALAGYFLLRNRAPETAVAAPPAVEPAPALGGPPPSVEVPPLDDSDAFVRDLVKALSSHPSIAAWLTTDGLIRNFAVGVVNVAEGNTPAPDLKVLRPPSAFAVVERGDDLVIDPRSYQRYDTLAAAAASVDPAGSARLYATLKPRLDEAHVELGLGAAPFDRTLERAIVLLLETPIVNDPIRVEPHGIGYGFADPKLEDLAPAQKQLLRMGARNVRTVHASLRAIALALGIPVQQLPPPPTM